MYFHPLPLTKLSLAGIPAGVRKIDNLFYSVIFDLVLIEDVFELLHDPGLRVEELDGEVHQLAARHAIRKIVSARWMADLANILMLLPSKKLESFTSHKSK